MLLQLSLHRVSAAFSDHFATHHHPNCSNSGFQRHFWLNQWHTCCLVCSMSNSCRTLAFCTWKSHNTANTGKYGDGRLINSLDYYIFLFLHSLIHTFSRLQTDTCYTFSTVVVLPMCSPTHWNPLFASPAPVSRYLLALLPVSFLSFQLHVCSLRLRTFTRVEGLHDSDAFKKNFGTSRLTNGGFSLQLSSSLRSAFTPDFWLSLAAYVLCQTRHAA